MERRKRQTLQRKKISNTKHRPIKVARTYLLASWLHFLMTLFRSKDFTDFYDSWLPK